MSGQQTALAVTLPQTIVEDIVKAEIVRHLGQRDELIASILGNTMGAECKCDKHRYNQPKRTVFACELEKQIEGVVKEIIAEWIHVNRTKFQAELQKRLARPEQLKNLAGAFANGIVAGAWKVNVELKPTADD